MHRVPPAIVEHGMPDGPGPVEQGGSCAIRWQGREDSVLAALDVEGIDRGLGLLGLEIEEASH